MKPDNNVYRKSSITRSVMLFNCFGVFIILRYQILLNKSNLFFYKVNNNRLNKSLFPHLSKCHPTPILPQTSFFSRFHNLYAQNLQAEPFSQIQKETISQQTHTQRKHKKSYFTLLYKKIAHIQPKRHYRLIPPDLSN